MIAYGNGQRRRLQRAEKYLELCGTKMYGVINEMARYTGKVSAMSEGIFVRC